jgi:hypothetical protein
MAVKVDDVAGKVADAIEDVVTTAETPESKDKKNEPELSEEGAFFIRRVAEEVTKSVASLLNPPKGEDTEDDSESDAKPRKRKTPPKPEPKKRGFLPNFFKR